MKQFYQDFGFIIGFLVMTLIIEMAFGQKAQMYFLLLILFSMIILNSTNFTEFVDEKFAFKVNENS